MRRYAVLAVSFLAVLVPEAAHAACVATGQISRVSVNPGGAASSFYVTTSTPAQPSYLYQTLDAKIVTAVIVAQASHMTVRATGTAAACPAPAGGVVAAGTVTSFTTAP